MEAEDFITWGKTPDTTMFSIHLPADGKVATIGNGVMIALRANSREQVTALHNTPCH